MLAWFRVHLDKFYLDVVDASGAGGIGYAARIDGFGLAATLAATLSWTPDADDAAEQRRTWRGRLPETAGAELGWKCPALGVAGTWKAAGPVWAEQVLWRNASGAVRWQVLAPRARVEMHLGSRTISGWGYAERLRLEGSPWRLPIDGLHWGRFVSPDEFVVWIRWDHAQPRGWLRHNGDEQTEFDLDADAIRWSGGQIELGPRRPLRSGQLADTVLAQWPQARRWLPARLQAINETKWCTRGTLARAGCTGVPGWVVHEYVRLK